MLSGAYAQGLDDPLRGLLESQPATVVLHQANSEVVQRLLGQVGLLHIQPQGVVPQQVELHLLQGFLVGEVEHLFEDVDSQDGLHCPIGAPVVGAVHRCESLLVNEGEGLVSEDLGPTPLQALGFLRRHQELGLPEALLLVSRSEHAPLPRPGATHTTFPYIIPALPPADEGFLLGNHPWTVQMLDSQESRLSVASVHTSVRVLPLDFRTAKPWSAPSR